MSNKKYLNTPIRQLSADAEYPDDEFRFVAEISNKDLDSHYSRMDDNTLDNFVKDINDGGVALLNGHQRGGIEDNWGRWIEAKRDGDKVIATASMLRSNESTPPHLNVDEHIRRIERGYYRDVSVGFYGHKEICDLCDNEVFNWTSKNRCSHWPGQEYEHEGEKTIATYEIKDANLSECSLVYDGANDSANILNVRNAPKELVDWKNKDLKETSTKQSELSELEKIGLKYKSDLIDQLVIEGVRALGDDFDEDKQREKYNRWSIDDIQEQIETYKKFTNFTGGRKIKDPSSQSGEGTQLPSWIYG